MLIYIVNFVESKNLNKSSKIIDTANIDSYIDKIEELRVLDFSHICIINKNIELLDKYQMKIISIEPYVLTDKLAEPFYFSQWEYDTRSICLVKITTDDGIFGWGEGYGPANVLKNGIEFLSQFIIGLNPIENDTIWSLMYRRTLDYARSGILMAAVSAIDVALWDVKGKALGLPVYNLLGGKRRDYLEPYATGLYFSKGEGLKQRLVDEALIYKKLHFRGIKMKVGINVPTDIEYVHAVRDAIGPDLKLMIDSNHAYNLVEAVRLSKALEDCNIYWFEEPVSPEYYSQYYELRQKTFIPIAGGECEYTRYGFNRLFQNKSVDIAQPDICAAGGISEVKRIATLASIYGVKIIPHSWGTRIALSAAMHVAATLDIEPGRLDMPEQLIEYDCTENALRDKLTKSVMTEQDGLIQIKDAPGLGVEVDENYLNYILNDNK